MRRCVLLIDMVFAHHALLEMLDRWGDAASSYAQNRVSRLALSNKWRPKKFSRIVDKPAPRINASAKM